MKRNIDYVGKEVPTEKETSEVTKSDITENEGVMVYSKVLQKPFNTLEELKKAEAEYYEQKAISAKAVEEKKAAAKEVEDAYKELNEAKRKAAELIKNAEEKYLAKRNEFVNKYHQYHMTYSNINGKEHISFSDVIEHMFDNFFRF